MKLEFGLNKAIPPDARNAWGARLIVTQDGFVDLVPDRQGCAGEDPEAFLELLNTEFPLDKLLTAFSALLISGQMSTREEHTFTLFRSDKLEVAANTNASAGYCYIAAWPVLQ
jgi:hypothetical protein